MSRGQNAANKPPQVIVHESLESLKKVIELDTDSSLADLSLLEKLNNESLPRYRALRQEMSDFEETARSAEATYEEVEGMGPKLDQLEAQVDNLMLLAEEIDEWSKELEVKVKVKRYAK